MAGSPVELKMKTPSVWCWKVGDSRVTIKITTVYSS